jgi:CHAD domain-containing protein
VSAMSKEEADFPLLKYLDELVENLRKLSGKALRGQDVTAVHHARVATRRLKAATDMLSPLISKRCKKPFQKATRNLRRRLGPLRDLDVMLGHLAEIKDVKFQPAKAWLKYRLNEARYEAVEEAKSTSPASHSLAKLGSWWGLHEEIAQVQDSIDEILINSVHLQLSAFSEQASDQQGGDPHALRIAGKSLRYTLEMAKAHGRRLPAVITMFKRLQDELGLWHDYVVLTERMLCETVECDLVLHDSQLQEQILSLAQVILRKAQRHLAKMRELWNERGEDLCRQIRHAFPMTDKEKAPQPEAEPEPAAPPPVEEKFPDAVAAEIPALPAV